MTETDRYIDGEYIVAKYKLSRFVRYNESYVNDRERVKRIVFVPRTKKNTKTTKWHGEKKKRRI